MAINGLTDDEEAAFTTLQPKHKDVLTTLGGLENYYNGEQRLQHLGIALPEEFRDFQVIVNVPRMAVDEPTARQELTAFQRSGQAKADPVLREAWEVNNLDVQAPQVHTDRGIFGRSIVSVSTNPDDAEHPLILGEDPRQFVYRASTRTRRLEGAVRLWKEDFDTTNRATLYMPDSTVWMVEDEHGWVVEERDDHELGAVPLVLFLNRARTGKFTGRSEMASVIPLTDAAGRIITNLQVGAETHAVPTRWAAALAKEDFVDKDGNPIPAWESYFTAIMATSSKDAKFGQFSASNLSNFTDTVNAILSWCAGELGFPVRFMGQTSTNPASEGAIVADEVRLIKNAESKNRSDGASWCWVMGLHERLRTGEWPATNSVRALWRNPATPTRAQIADAAVKLHAEGIMSREGVWDEMGWDEPRKDRERSYFEKEQADPTIAAVLREVNGGNVGGDTFPADPGAQAPDGGAGGDVTGAGVAP